MRIVGLPRVFYSVALHAPTVLSPKAQERLRWLSAWQSMRKDGLSSKESSQALGIPRSTLYRWQKWLQGRGAKRLEDLSRKPHHCRYPTWSPALIDAVLHLRQAYPAWGKMKLTPLLKQQRWPLSQSTVGRILSYLKQKGEIEPVPVQRRLFKGHRRQQRRPWAQRLPRGHPIQLPGDLVQVDTLTYSPLPGVTLKQITARDVVCRWDVLEVFSRATAHTARLFLDRLRWQCPFPIRGIQVDGGSEFRAEFEQECQKRGIRLFLLPPRSPRLNGYVERAQGTHRYEFYEAYDLPWKVTELRPLLRQWE